MRLDEILKLIEAPEDGTFVGVKFLPADAQKLESFSIENQVPNPNPATKMHITLLFSTNPIPDYKPYGQYKSGLTATPKDVKIWGEDEEKVLVLILESPQLVKRHQYLMKKHPNAKWDFPEYIPHVTLSYDVGDFDPKVLDISKLGKLTLVEEYGEDIDPEYHE